MSKSRLKARTIGGFAVVDSDGKTVCTPSFMRRQRLMLYLLFGVPALSAIAAAVWAFYRPIGLVEITLMILMWLVTGGLGIEVGFHRFLVHRSFEANGVVRLLLIGAGAMAFQGPPLYWAALHRRHHELSDGEGDPHSPQPKEPGFLGRLRGLWHGHVGWIISHEVPNTLHYVPDLLKDRAVLWVNRHYLVIALVGLLLPAGIAGAVLHSWDGVLAGLLWGGIARVFLVTNLIWSVNSICHFFGSRDYDTRDESRNVALLALPTFGGSWHNNHHAFPTSARTGVRWWQLDLAYLMIRLMACLRLVSHVRLSDGTPARPRNAGTEQGGDDV